MTLDGTAVPWDGTKADPATVYTVAGMMPEWCARVDGDVVMQVIGPDAEALCRAVAGAVVAYRKMERPTAANGWQLHGPWIDVE